MSLSIINTSLTFIDIMYIATLIWAKRLYKKNSNYQTLLIFNLAQYDLGL
jgi:hypothetical protein